MVKEKKRLHFISDFIFCSPGISSQTAGQTSICKGCPNQEACLTKNPLPDPDIDYIKRRMESVQKKIIILSGKGGVGKSTFTAQLAWCLSTNKKQVKIHDLLLGNMFLI